MKKFVSVVILLFVSFAQAQNSKVELQATIDEINKIISQNKLFFYVDNDSVMNENDNTFNVVDLKLSLKEITVNPLGDVSSVDETFKNKYSNEAFTQSQPKYKKTLFNVFEIKNIEELFKTKYAKRKDGKRDQYFFAQNFNFNKLKSLLLKLKEIGIKDTDNLTLPQAKEYIYWYFKNFETGNSEYENNNKYRSPFKKITGNYVIEIQDTNVNLSYNVYDFTFQTLLESKKVTINLKDIVSIQQGPDFLLLLPDGSSKIINSSLSFNKTKEGSENDETINIQTTDVNNFREILIVKAFKKLLELSH